jgi:4a-hydroxytetrahydrobiopterin dehydratase
MTTLITTLTAREIDSHLELRPDWKIEAGELVRTFKFETFPDAISFVKKIAGLAEEAGHHPDIDIRYNRVKLALVSHDAGGLTSKDFAIAAAADGLA